MDETTNIDAVVKACLLNAEGLLEAAKAVRQLGKNHAAYHLAAIALEEIGKASMMAVSSLRQPRPRTKDGDDDEERRPADWIEDHERKLFWALWMPSFGRHRNTVEEIRQFQALARHIHELRLASLYVDPLHPAAQEVVSDRDIDTLLSLTEARLGMEKVTEFRQLDEPGQQLLEWFFRAADDPQLKMIVFNTASFAKLAELDGDAKKWMTWLHDSLEEMNRINRELAEEELRRAQPGEADQNDPKWRLKLRLKSWSHSIRPEPLSKWNEQVDGIKLSPGADKTELIIQFTMPKKIPIQALWQVGMQNSYLFVIALNIGTVGFFWWYLPTFVSKYYEQLTDIQNNASVIVERNPQLIVSWGHQALKQPQLMNVVAVFAHLARATPEQRNAYDRYFRALGLLAKNDIFGQFESMIMVEFYEAFRAGLAAYKDWDASATTFEAAAQVIFEDLQMGSDFLTDMKQVFQLADQLVTEKTVSKPVTLDEVAKMKVYCDVYFLTRARNELDQREKKQMASSS